jgi:hypothetical protein
VGWARRSSFALIVNVTVLVVVALFTARPRIALVTDPA